MHQILIAGPVAGRPFLERLAQSINEVSASIDCSYGLTTPDEYPDWRKMTIFVSYGLPCSAADMDAAPGLKAIITPSLGYEGIDIDAARERGIAFANGRVEENYQSVAEAAILYMLTSLYRLREAEDRLRRGELRTGPPEARMLKGRTIGIIGYGNIAKAVIERLQGWETRIFVSNRSAIAHPAVTQTGIDALLAESDIILPLLPLTPETEGLLSRERLLAAKAGAILINLSRGAIIEESALTDPEVIAHLGTIALDVFTNEPLAADSPLRDLPDHILTNHEISHTQENLGALFALAVANIQAAIEGRALPSAI